MSSPHIEINANNILDRSSSSSNILPPLDLSGKCCGLSSSSTTPLSTPTTPKITINSIEINSNDNNSNNNNISSPSLSSNCINSNNINNIDNNNNNNSSSKSNNNVNNNFNIDNQNNSNINNETNNDDNSRTNTNGSRSLLITSNNNVITNHNNNNKSAPTTPQSSPQLLSTPPQSSPQLLSTPPQSSPSINTTTATTSQLNKNEDKNQQQPPYTTKRRSSLQINEASPKFITIPSVEKTICILDYLPCPIFQIGIVENSENGNITLNGFANERLTTLLSCSSNQLVDSLKSIPSPHYNTFPPLENNSIPINNLGPGLLPNTDPTKILDPYISLYNKKQQQLDLENQHQEDFNKEIFIQHQAPSKEDQSEQNLKESVNDETFSLNESSNSISRPNSILQCILDSFHEQKTISEKVLLSNFLIRQQYKARATIKPFSDGCLCIFENIININLNYQPKSILSATKFLQNEMEMLNLSPDVHSSPFIHSSSNNSLNSLGSTSSLSSASALSSATCNSSISNESGINSNNSNCGSSGSSNISNISNNTNNSCSSSNSSNNNNSNSSYPSSLSSSTSSTPTKNNSKSIHSKIPKNSKQSRIYSLLLSSFENLSFLLKSTPLIVWRADHNGNLVFFKKLDEIPIDEKKCSGNSFQDFLQWVPSTYRTNFSEMFENNLKTRKVFEFLYWFQTPNNYVQLYKIAGYPIYNDENKGLVGSKNQVIGWLGVTFNYLINDGAEVSIKGSANLDCMLEKFKSLYEMPNIERTRLGCPNISGPSESSSSILLEKKKHLISEAEKECFLKCKDTYNILFRLSLLGVMFSTFKGIVLDANDMLLQTIGYTRSDLENGKIDWMLLTPPEYFEISARALQELKAKRWCQPIEKAYIHKSGKRVPVLITSAMIDGSTEQCITFVFDLSRYRQAELAAIEATRLKTQFITNISHELRTPCHGIVGMSQLLLDSTLTPTQRDNVDSIKRSTDSLISLINDILDFSKLEYGKVTLENESFELLPMIEEVLDSQSSIVNQKGIDLIFIMGRDYPVPPVIFGDRNSLKKVLLNLVGNAVKFTETGFVLLEISTDYESGDQISLRFTVKDSGIGIPEDKIEQIFVPFGQIDGSFSRKYGGSGLGLSFCKELVALMGGYIRVESGDQDGKGTTFWFSIKVSISSPSYLPNSVPAANQFFYPEYRPSHAPNATSKNCLIVESNQLVNQSIQSILLSMKCECINASKLNTAADIIETSRNTNIPINVILVSDKLPFIEELLELITNDEKVILYGTDPNSKWLENQKVFSYLLTPITHSKIINSIIRSKNLLKNELDNNNNNNNSIIEINNDDSNNNSNTTDNIANDNSNKNLEIQKQCLQKSNESTTSTTVTQKKYILVAEDNDINIKIVVRQLEKLGYTVVIGINGLKALEVIGSVPFCLILLDCQMPEMDGFTCSKIIRELEPNGQRIPIIAMTANDSKDKCFEVGMDDYLSKPVKIDKLQKTLSDWIKVDENGNPSKSYNFYPSLSYSLVYNNFIENSKNEDHN